jgi:hypothetical protein
LHSVRTQHKSRLGKRPLCLKLFSPVSLLSGLIFQYFLKKSYEILLPNFYVLSILWSPCQRTLHYTGLQPSPQTASGNPRSDQSLTRFNYLQAFISVPFVVTIFPGKFGSQGHNQEVYRVGDDHIVVHGADDVHNQDGESSAWQKTSHIVTPKQYKLSVVDAHPVLKCSIKIYGMLPPHRLHPVIFQLFGTGMLLSQPQEMTSTINDTSSVFIRQTLLSLCN